MHKPANAAPNDQVVGPGGPQGGALFTGKKPQASERRRHARCGIVDQEFVPIQLGGNNGGLVVDLSAGGAAIVCAAPLERNSTSPFVLQFADSTAVEGTGSFVWVDGSGLTGGLRFDRLSPVARQLLDKWLRRLASEPRTPVITEERPAMESTNEESAIEAGAAAPEPARSVPKAAPAFADKLQRLAERARLVALANGACIALRIEDGYRCEASVGTAPAVGLAVSLERGLAAECIAGKHLVVCNDALRDPRVNATVRQQLNFRSAIYLPLRRENGLVGILGVFSDRPDSFGQQTIARLQDAAQLIESSWKETAVVQPARVPADPNPDFSAQANGSEPRPVHSGLAASAARVFTVALIATILLLASVYFYELETAPQPSQPKPTVSPAQPATEHLTTQPPATALPAVVPPKSPAAEAPPKHSPETTVAPDQYRIFQPSAAKSPVREQVSSPPATAATHSQTITPVAIPPENKAEQPPVTVPAPVADPARVPAQATPVTSAAQEAVKAAAPVPQASGHVQVLTDVLSPKLPAAAARPEVVSKADIQFPASALASHRQGSVILKVTVDSAGAVKNVEVLDGDSVLAAEAVRAVRQWRYKPYGPAGQETGLQLLLTINFVLST